MAFKKTRKRKILKGKVAYLLSVLSTLLQYQFRDVTIEVDEKVYHRKILLVAIANGSYYGGGMQVAPKANMEDGKLDVCIISCLPKWKIPFLLPKFIKGDHLHFSFVEYYRGEHVRISSSIPSPLNIDGELVGSTPLECSLKPLSLSVFVS
jgi:diacylglycerol kinase (ATP)